MAYCETMRASRLDGDVHSVVRRKVEYVPQPSGLGANRVTPIGGYLLIIPSNLPEERFKLAAEAISWMTSHDAMKAHVTNGFPIAPRFSVSADPETVVASPLVRVVEKFARRHLLQTWQRPGVPQYTAIEAVLGEEIHAALLKRKSDKEALSNASDRIGRILGSDQRFGADRAVGSAASTASQWVVSEAHSRGGRVKALGHADQNLHLIAAGIEQRPKPFSTTSSASIWPVMIFSTGSLPLSISEMTRGHIVTG